MGAILRYFLLAVLAVIATRWLRKVLSRGGDRPGSRGPLWPGTRQTDKAPRSKLKVLRFRSDPLKVLGLGPSATDADIRQAYLSAMAENDPEKVADMGEEIQDLAYRRQREVEAAYEQLCGEE